MMTGPPPSGPPGSIGPPSPLGGETPSGSPPPSGFGPPSPPPGPPLPASSDELHAIAVANPRATAIAPIPRTSIRPRISSLAKYGLDRGRVEDDNPPPMGLGQQRMS